MGTCSSQKNKKNESQMEIRTDSNQTTNQAHYQQIQEPPKQLPKQLTGSDVIKEENKQSIQQSKPKPVEVQAAQTITQQELPKYQKLSDIQKNQMQQQQQMQQFSIPIDDKKIKNDENNDPAKIHLDSIKNQSKDNKQTLKITPPIKVQNQYKVEIMGSYQKTNINL